MREQMMPLGWIFMAFIWTVIIGLNVYCFVNIFRDRKEEIPDPLPAMDEDCHVSDSE
jgi:hypothetical protein